MLILLANPQPDDRFVRADGEANMRSLSVYPEELVAAGAAEQKAQE